MTTRLTAIALAAAGLVASAALWLRGGGELRLPWAPTLDLELAFRFDGLAALYALLATGVGLAVFVYSTGYLPIHLHHQGRPLREEHRFYAFLILFMVSMVGLATAQDLVLLIVFWDLTAIASYFLIGYDRQDESDRYAALVALVVTGTTAILLIVGALLLHHRYETFYLPDLLGRLEGDATTIAAAVLIAIAGLAKSAQVPFHFWLPRAMAAPTPVSSYLHSAAMVAAGVFLLGRVYPLLAASPYVLDGLLVVGIASMAIGGVIALTRDGLKHVLAYSTVAQYGYVVFLLGLGTDAGLAAATFYVLMHGLAKCALFLTAGAATVATGENRLSTIGGLARELPLVAAASAVAAAAIVALPLTSGFFADELFFEAALERGTAFVVVALASAVLTFAYIVRFWAGIFLGPRAGAEPLPRTMTAPLVALAAVLLVTGIVVHPLARLAGEAASVSAQRLVEIEPAYHLDARVANLLALGTYALGLAVLAGRRRWWGAATAAAGAGARYGPDRVFALAVRSLNRLSDSIHALEVRDLRTRVAAVFVPGGALVLLGLAVTPTRRAYEIGAIGGDDLGLVFVLAATGVGAIAATLPRHHLTLVLALSSVGFGLAIVYAFFGGPDVALVAVLVETVVALLFLGAFSLLPRSILDREASLPEAGSRRWRDPLVGVISAGVAFVVVWGALSRPAPEESVSAELSRLAPEAHAQDVVTAILADFRGLDTLVEITVVAVAAVAVVALLRRGRT